MDENQLVLEKPIRLTFEYFNPSTCSWENLSREYWTMAEFDQYVCQACPFLRIDQDKYEELPPLDRLAYVVAHLSEFQQGLWRDAIEAARSTVQ